MRSSMSRFADARDDEVMHAAALDRQSCFVAAGAASA
jgi:hypothetical protein